MPSESGAQQRLFAIAEHHPEKLHANHRALASLSKKTLHDFAATSRHGLPDHVPPHGAVHALHRRVSRE